MEMVGPEELLMPLLHVLAPYPDQGVIIASSTLAIHVAGCTPYQSAKDGHKFGRLTPVSHPYSLVPTGPNFE